ncbi:hypothetical protein B0H11DRAFT_2267609 [Mycena galericulata]|nr:hypothetical protein B0H11DRAFT_2267609 [Mycena galericulata]
MWVAIVWLAMASLLSGLSSSSLDKTCSAIFPGDYVPGLGFRARALVWNNVRLYLLDEVVLPVSTTVGVAVLE